MAIQTTGSRGADGHVSSTPLVGSILAFIAVLLAPTGTIPQRLRWSWLPLAVAVEVGVAVGCGLVFRLATPSSNLPSASASRRPPK